MEVLKRWARSAQRLLSERGIALAVMLLAVPAAIWGGHAAGAAPAPPELAGTGVIELPERAALAEDAAPAAELGSITVLGSRIRRSDAASAAPVMTLSRAQLDASGRNTLGDLLLQLPIAGTGTSTRNVRQISTAAGTEIDLRHLGPGRVLVLVDGRRWLGGVSTFRTSSPDLNTIPLGMVERVEILKDGASAVYGTDAISGVVNIITRREQAGTELRVSSGQYLQAGDGASHDISASSGHQWGRSSLLADLSYARQGEVRAIDRAATRVPRAGTGLTRTFPWTEQGRFLFVPDPQTVTHPCVADGFCNLTVMPGEDGQEQSDFVDFDINQHGSNYLEELPLSIPGESLGLFGKFNHIFNAGFELNADIFVHRRKVKQRFPFFLNWFSLGDGNTAPALSDIFVARDNPFNPFGQDIGRASGDDDIGQGQVFRWATELGATFFRHDIRNWRASFGLTGEQDWFGSFVAWELGGAFNRSTDEIRNDDIDLRHLRLGLGPLADCEADRQCVPLNVFGGQAVDGQGSITAAMADYVGRISRWRYARDEIQTYLTASHAGGVLPAGPIQWAYGLEYRVEDYSLWTDPLLASGQTMFGETRSAQGDNSVAEAFLEVELPLLRSKRSRQALDLNLALRYSDYARLSGVTNGRVGLRWQPLPGLVLRGTVADAFRAPALGEQFDNGGPKYGSWRDPCSDWSASDDPNVRANCESDGVPADYVQGEDPVVLFQRGDAGLGPEQSRTQTVGIVLSPSAIDDFDVSLDWYRIELRDAIQFLDPDFILQSCYVRAERNDTCELIARNPDDGSLLQIDNPFDNIAALQVQGLDLEFDWGLPTPGLPGELRWRTTLAYLEQYTEVIQNARGRAEATHLQGRNRGALEAAYPRLKANTSLAWHGFGLSASWTTRYVSSLRESCDDGGSPSYSELGLCSDPDRPGGAENELDAVWYHDVQIGFPGRASSWSVTMGLNNLLGQDPPASYAGTLLGFNSYVHDIPGRFGYLKFRVNF